MANLIWTLNIHHADPYWDTPTLYSITAQDGTELTPWLEDKDAAELLLAAAPRDHEELAMWMQIQSELDAAGDPHPDNCITPEPAYMAWPLCGYNLG